MGRIAKVRIWVLLPTCLILAHCQQMRGADDDRTLHMAAPGQGALGARWALDCEISPIEGNKVCHLSHPSFGVIELAKPVKFNVEMQDDYKKEMVRLGALDDEGRWAGKAIRIGHNLSPSRSTALRVDQRMPHYGAAKGMIIGNEADSVIAELTLGESVVVEYTEMPDTLRRETVSLAGLPNLIRVAGIWVGRGAINQRP